MKNSRILPITLMAFTSALMACTDPTNPNGSSGSSSSGGESGDITGSARDTYWSKNGDELVYPKDRWSKIEAISDQTYLGTFIDTGGLTIPNVPMGPYWLALTGVVNEKFPMAQAPRTFVETDAREIDIGRLNTGRSDILEMKQPSNIVIDATFSTPFQVYTEDMNGQVLQPLTDELQIISRGAGMWCYSDVSADGTGPTDGAMQVPGWTFDMQANFQNLMGQGAPLIEAAKGDDFVLIHGVAAMEGNEMPDGNPWTGYQYFSAKESASIADVTTVDGSTTNVIAGFTTLDPKNFALDYKGAAFNALLPAGLVDPVSVSLSVVMEVGAPNPGVGTFASLLSVTSGTEMAYTNPDPACQGAGCDPMACASTCDPGMQVHPGDYAHTYSYGNPFSYGQELFTAVITFGKNVRTLLPEMTAERLRGYLSISVPVAEAAGKPIQPTLSLPQNIKVGGQSTNYDQIMTGVGTSPTVSWDAPSIGTPSKYRVLVIDLTDLTGLDGATSSRRTVATMETKGTQVTIPDGIMTAGTNYYFQVTAYAQDKYDSGKPFVFAQHEAAARMFTGVVTP